eukprot:364409-Chlamydomonas_euryale.AAC.7
MAGSAVFPDHFCCPGGAGMEEGNALTARHPSSSPFCVSWMSRLYTVYTHTLMSAPLALCPSGGTASQKKPPLPKNLGIKIGGGEIIFPGASKGVHSDGVIGRGEGSGQVARSSFRVCRRACALMA